MKSVQSLYKKLHGPARHFKSMGKKRKAVIIAEVFLGAIAVSLAFSVSAQGPDTLSSEAQAVEVPTEEQIVSEPDAPLNIGQIKDIPDQIEQGPSCSHIWTPITQTLEHPEISHEVKHEAVFEMHTSLHTVCNECEKIIDGRARSHIESTGHSGFTTSVPVPQKTLVSDAWTETIVDEPAWDETVTCGYSCALCSAKTDVSQ